MGFAKRHIPSCTSPSGLTKNLPKIPHWGISCLTASVYRNQMNPLPIPVCNKIAVILVSHLDQIPNLISELALFGHVTVLDGGNCFPAYRIAQLIRRKSLQVDAISKRIIVRRAFTCHQMVNLLESEPASGQPHIILNLLSTFQDDQVKPNEADRLLTICFSNIDRLRVFAPVVISLEPAILAEKEFLLKRVYEKADEVFPLPFPKSPQEEQLSLFRGM